VRIDSGKYQTLRREKKKETMDPKNTRPTPPPQTSRSPKLSQSTSREGEGKTQVSPRSAEGTFVGGLEGGRCSSWDIQKPAVCAEQEKGRGAKGLREGPRKKDPARPRGRGRQGGGGWGIRLAAERLKPSYQRGFGPLQHCPPSSLGERNVGEKTYTAQISESVGRDWNATPDCFTV